MLARVIFWHIITPMEIAGVDEVEIELDAHELELLTSLADLNYLHTVRKRPLSETSISRQLGMEPEDVRTVFYLLDEWPITYGVAPRRRNAYIHPSIVKFNIAVAKQKKDQLEVDEIGPEEWQAKLDAAPPELGISDIAILIDRSMGWVSKMIKQLEVEPLTHVLACGRWVAKYNETAAQALRDYEQQWPKHGSWFNTQGLIPPSSDIVPSN